MYFKTCKDLAKFRLFEAVNINLLQNIINIYTLYVRIKLLQRAKINLK